MLIDNLDLQFDVVALTKTWHTIDYIHFNHGTLTGYHKYDGAEGSSNKDECDLKTHWLSQADMTFALNFKTKDINLR